MRSVGLQDHRPLIMHIVHHFICGGLENGIANLVNRMPDDGFRHCIVALTEVSSFRDRIKKQGVTVHCINKHPGKDPAAYLRLYRLISTLKPTIVHTRNIGTLECLFVAWLAGVPVRIHGEHGWDIFDPNGTRHKYRLVRRLIAPFVHRFVTVSNDLAEWLVMIGIRECRIRRICNGVDTVRFRPRDAAESRGTIARLFPPEAIVIGSVTRFSAIKDPLNLVEAFVRLRQSGDAENVCLVMVGDGELLEPARARLREAGLEQAAWLPGSRDDIPALLRDMDVFVLGSRREGISNTILEAMASGLPVIATDTGGNHELVVDNVTGKLVAPGNAHALSEALRKYVTDANQRHEQGQTARERACSRFSLATMTSGYLELYSNSLQSAKA